MNRTLDAIVLRYAGYALLFLACAYMIYLVRDALPVFIIGALLAYAIEPVLKWLEQRGYSRGGAVGFVFLVFLLIFVLLLALLASALQQAQELQANLQPYLDKVTHWRELAESLVQRSPLPTNAKSGALAVIERSAGEFSSWVQSFALSSMQAIVGSLGGIVIYLVILPIVTLNFMMEMNAIRGRALMLVPPMHRRDVIDIAGTINELLGRYVRGQMIVCGLFGLLCTVTFWILGVTLGMQYGVVLGVLAGVVYIVPYVGVLAIIAISALTAYLTSSNPMLCAGLVVGLCVVYNLTIDYVVAPRVLGKGIGLHPLLVIFALLAGEALGGPLYMLLAVPVVASLRVILIFLFPQLAAPLPETPPEADGTDRRNDVVEIIKQVAEAEAKTEAQSNETSGEAARSLA